MQKVPGIVIITLTPGEANLKLPVPGILSDLIYPTNYAADAYHNYDVNNVISAINEFIHGNVG
jgi:hypothetical protein